jgi:hypothetical protein
VLRLQSPNVRRKPLLLLDHEVAQEGILLCQGGVYVGDRRENGFEFRLDGAWNFSVVGGDSNGRRFERGLQAE